eukprot:17097-Heterococcus_DN1.PRE.2
MSHCSAVCMHRHLSALVLLARVTQHCILRTDLFNAASAISKCHQYACSQWYICSAAATAAASAIAATATATTDSSSSIIDCFAC